MAESVRSFDDFQRAVSAIAEHFDVSVIYVIGSQAAFGTAYALPERMCLSNEIDLYPKYPTAWQSQHPDMEASEEINGFFGYGSPFHSAYGYYLDGVSSATANLPEGWEERAQRRDFKRSDGQPAVAVTPCLDDLIVSKLQRFDEKDRQYARVAILDSELPTDIDAIAARFQECAVIQERIPSVLAFLEELRNQLPSPPRP